MTMKKYRIKTHGVYDHIFDVQMRRWYGWTLIKSFKSNSIAPDFVRYARELAKGLLDKLEEEL